jgi:TatD DNase family protein
MKPINFHTHHPKVDGKSIEIYVQDIRHTIPLFTKADYFCTGLHPWYLNDYNLSDVAKRLNDVVNLKNFFGIGEIGLDKSCGIDFELQKVAFQKQVELANELKIKTIILHSVRSNNECHKILKDFKYQGNILFHDFHGKIEEFNQFEKDFNCIISISEKFLQSQKSTKLLTQIKLEKVVIETDDLINYNLNSFLDKFSFKTKIHRNLILKNHHHILNQLKQN